MDLHAEENGVEPFDNLEEDDDNVEEGDNLPELPPTLLELSQPNSEKEDTGEMVNELEDEEDEEDDDDEDDDEDVAAPPPEGSYDPSEFDHLNVEAEVKDLFGYIMK